MEEQNKNTNGRKQGMNLKRSSFAIIIVCALITGMIVGNLGGGLLGKLNLGFVTMGQSEYREMKEISERYSKAETLLNQAVNNYYIDVNESDLEEAMYKGILEGLNDPYSEYMTKDEYEEWKISLTGEYEGVGLTMIENDKGEAEIISVTDGSPAKKGGIKKGDIIVKVDGETYKNLEDVAAAIRGDAGTKVKITYARGKKEKTVTMTREQIESNTVSSKVISEDIGYIAIGAFEESTAEDFKKALTKMENKKVKGLVIDLRDNGGGLVEEGREVADMLLGKGVIAYTENRQGEKDYMKSGSSKTKLPYVMLVNGNSASTTELLAAAVKDNNEGVLVGKTTFGKGIIQITQQLSDGSAFKLTVMQYFSPDGHAIHENGVEPDYKINGRKAQLNKAVEALDEEAGNKRSN